VTEEHTSEAVREALNKALIASIHGGPFDLAVVAMNTLAAMGRVVVPVSIPRAMQDTFFDDGDFEQTFRGLWDDMIAAAASPMEAPTHE
jgi:hypothetical protein